MKTLSLSVGLLFWCLAAVASAQEIRWTVNLANKTILATNHVAVREAVPIRIINLGGANGGDLTVRVYDKTNIVALSSSFSGTPEATGTLDLNTVQLWTFFTNKPSTYSKDFTGVIWDNARSRLLGNWNLTIYNNPFVIGQIPSDALTNVNYLTASSPMGGVLSGPSTNLSFTAAGSNAIAAAVQALGTLGATNFVYTPATNEIGYTAWVSNSGQTAYFLAGTNKSALGASVSNADGFIGIAGGLLSAGTNALNRIQTLAAVSTVSNLAMAVGAGASNFTLQAWSTGSNALTVATAAATNGAWNNSVGGASNLALAVGAGSTNLAYAIGLGASNFTLQAWGTASNALATANAAASTSSVAAQINGVGAGATNFALKIGLGATSLTLQAWATASNAATVANAAATPAMVAGASNLAWAIGAGASNLALSIGLGASNLTLGAWATASNAHTLASAAATGAQLTNEINARIGTGTSLSNLVASETATRIASDTALSNLVAASVAIGATNFIFTPATNAVPYLVFNSNSGRTAHFSLGTNTLPYGGGATDVALNAFITNAAYNASTRQFTLQGAAGAGSSTSVTPANLLANGGAGTAATNFARGDWNAAASNLAAAAAADATSRLASNVWAAAGSTTNYISRVSTGLNDPFVADSWSFLTTGLNGLLTIDNTAIGILANGSTILMDSGGITFSGGMFGDASGLTLNYNSITNPPNIMTVSAFNATITNYWKNVAFPTGQYASGSSGQMAAGQIGGTGAVYQTFRWTNRWIIQGGVWP